MLNAEIGQQGPPSETTRNRPCQAICIFKAQVHKGPQVTERRRNCATETRCEGWRILDRAKIKALLETYWYCPTEAAVFNIKSFEHGKITDRIGRLARHTVFAHTRGLVVS